MISYERRYCKAGAVYANLHSRGGYHQAVEAFQVCIRKRDCHVRPGVVISLPPTYSLIISLCSLSSRYAYFKKLDYFSTECIYSPDAYRGHARAFLKDLEAARPSAIIDIIHSGEAFEVKEEVKATQKAQRECKLSCRSDSTI